METGPAGRRLWYRRGPPPGEARRELLSAGAAFTAGEPRNSIIPRSSRFFFLFPELFTPPPPHLKYLSVLLLAIPERLREHVLKSSRPWGEYFCHNGCTGSKRAQRVRARRTWVEGGGGAFNINGVAPISCFIGGGKKEICVN